VLLKHVTERSVIDLASGKGWFKQTPLHLAARRGNEEAVKLLIKRGASIECLTPHGRTFLQLLCQNGHDNVALNIIQLLEQEYGSSLRSLIEHQDVFGISVVQSCCVGDCQSTLAHLIRGYPSLIQTNVSNPIETAIVFGSWKAALQLKTALGSEVSFDEQLKNYVELSWDSPMAYIKPDTEQALYVLSSDDQKLFHFNQILRNGDFGKLQHFVDVLGRGHLPPKVEPKHIISAAAAVRKQPIILFLLAHGLDPRIQNSQGINLALAAAQGGCTEVLRALLDDHHALDLLETRDAGGYSPLDIAACQSHVEATEYLRSKMGNVVPSQMAPKLKLILSSHLRSPDSKPPIEDKKKFQWKPQNAYRYDGWVVGKKEDSTPSERLTWADAELIALREAHQDIQIEPQVVEERIQKVQAIIRHILGNAAFQLFVNDDLVTALRQRQDRNSCILFDGSLLGGRVIAALEDSCQDLIGQNCVGSSLQYIQLELAGSMEDVGATIMPLASNPEKTILVWKVFLGENNVESADLAELFRNYFQLNAKRKMDLLAQLHRDLIYQVMDLLTMEDFCSFAQVSKTWQQLHKDYSKVIQTRHRIRPKGDDDEEEEDVFFRHRRKRY